MSGIAFNFDSLLPCPFCGGEAELKYISTLEARVICKRCHASAAKVNGYDTHIVAENAMELWNRRGNVRLDETKAVSLWDQKWK